MEWWILVAIGAGAVFWFLSSLAKTEKRTSAMLRPIEDTEILQTAKQKRDEYLHELIDCKKRTKKLELRNQALEARWQLADEILKIIEPPKWIDEYGMFLQRTGSSLGMRDDVAAGRTFHQGFTSRTNLDINRRVVSRLKTHLEEACWAILRNANATSAGTYAVTPLVTDSLQLLRELPDIIRINPFELRASDFQALALWLDMVERMGRERYLGLRELGPLLKMRLSRSSSNESIAGLLRLVTGLWAAQAL